jgi:hypothetical protein
MEIYTDLYLFNEKRGFFVFVFWQDWDRASHLQHRKNNILVHHFHLFCYFFQCQ